MPSIHALSAQEPQRLFDDIDRSFQLSSQDLVGLTKAFLHEISLGLASYGQPMAMIPTFVTGVPDGTETGTFLALDLGGTNLRVCEVALNGDKTFSLRQQKYKVSDSLKTGEATVLFDYLADSVDAFLTTHAASAYSYGSDVHLGLTFSFPVEQTALNAGTILTWTKGFSAKNAIGNDVVRLLQDAFDRKHMHVKCVALVNDTVGALLSRAYTTGGCVLGAIFGTGTNGAYVEEVAKITKLSNSMAAVKGGHMVVNTEWGAFNNCRSHLPFTPFDNALDRLSINPSYQAFEKFISGMYLGEITRNILISLIDASPIPLLFSGKSTPMLNKHYGLDTSVMSQIEEAWEEVTLKDAAVCLLSLLFSAAYTEYQIVRWACSLVARRAALLSGVAVATILFQTGRASFADKDGKFSNCTDTTRIGVGVDGSLIEHYPNYERILRESLCSLVGKEVEKRVDIGMAKDGSGVGAALCALQALKQRKSS
ncbi:Glucokinase-1 [Termitomyces sp. J132]|nr:Glucokinase-1 [Termitomyces sp. J132]